MINAELINDLTGRATIEFLNAWERRGMTAETMGECKDKAVEMLAVVSQVKEAVRAELDAMFWTE